MDKIYVVWYQNGLSYEDYSERIVAHHRSMPSDLQLEHYFRDWSHRHADKASLPIVFDEHAGALRQCYFMPMSESIYVEECELYP